VSEREDMALRSATRNLYNQRAADYVETTGRLELFPGLADELERFAGIALQSGLVLDLGCGVGRDSEYLLNKGRTVLAGDLSEAMLKITSDRCRSDRLHLVQLDMTRLPFEESVFAGAWICASLLHLPSRGISTALAELYRVLKPAGAVAISMTSGSGEGWHAGNSVIESRWCTFMEPGEFSELLAAQGFQDVTVAWSGRRDWFITEAYRPS